MRLGSKLVSNSQDYLNSYIGICKCSLVVATVARPTSTSDTEAKPLFGGIYNYARVGLRDGICEEIFLQHHSMTDFTYSLELCADVSGTLPYN